MPAALSERSAEPRAASWIAGWIGLWVACVGCSAEVAPAPHPRNAVLIVVDTLRRDHVGAYGYERDTTPAIDALAAEGVRFDRAYATSGWTAPSVASLLTGLVPSAHGVTRPKTALADRVPTLPLALQKAGFATAGIVSNAMLGRANGFDRGFDWFDQQQARGHRHVSTPAVSKTAVGLLKQWSSQSQRFFLFVHLFDPHYQYRRHREYGYAAEAAERLTGEESIHSLRALAPELSETEIAFIRDLYDEEIRHTDAGIDRIVAALREFGQLDDTLVVVTADHGEEFLERGWLGHTRTLYDELVRVPLIVRSPHSFARSSVSEPVSLTEIPGAILEWLGVDAGNSFAPTSLVALSRQPEAEPNGSPPGPPAFLEVDFVPVAEHNVKKTAKQQAVVAGRFKLIRDELAGRVELYDVVADPTERRDLAGEQPGRVRELTAVLDLRLHEARQNGFVGEPRELSDNERRQLQELGYGD